MHIILMCYALVIPLQTVPLQSIMHKLDECFVLGKDTVGGIPLVTAITLTWGRTLHKIDMSNIPMCYLGKGTVWGNITNTKGTV